jgi:F-type H+-transporting ATPase subunit b
MVYSGHSLTALPVFSLYEGSKMKFHRQILMVVCLLVGFGIVAYQCETPFVSSVMAATGDDAHGNEQPTPFPKWSTDLALFSLITFVLLIAILGKFAFKPIAKALDQREQQVADNITGAERANQEAKVLLSQYHDKLSEAEGEVKAIVEAGKKEAERAGELIIAKARDAAEAERVRAAKEIESATDGALQDLATRSADLAVSLAGKIIKQRLDADSHAELIQTAVSDFSRN